jgi:transcriptional regulator
MHPNSTFHWTDRDTIRHFVSERSFGALVLSQSGRPLTAHVPVVWLSEDHFGFHLARTNALFAHLDGAEVLFLMHGADGYVSPDWYGADDQVPTWNYVAVELHGTVKRLPDDAVHDQMDRLSAAHEARLNPKAPWTSAKMSPGLAERMARGVGAFAFEVSQWQGTRKLGQNKPLAERSGVAQGLRQAGNGALAALMLETENQ